MRNTEVSQAVQRLVQFNPRTKDRILFLWWNASDIEHHTEELTEEQRQCLWNRVWNNGKVQATLEQAERLVDDVLSEIVEVYRNEV